MTVCNVTNNISYAEFDDHHIYVNAVESDGRVSLAITVATDELSNAFATMTLGRVLKSMLLMDLLSQLKENLDLNLNNLVEQEGYFEDD